MRINDKLLDFAIAELKDIASRISAAYNEIGEPPAPIVLLAQMEPPCMLALPDGYADYLLDDASKVAGHCQHLLVHDRALVKCDEHGALMPDVVLIASAGRVAKMEKDVADEIEQSGVVPSPSEVTRITGVEPSQALVFQAHTISGVVIGYRHIDGGLTVGELVVIDPRESSLVMNGGDQSLNRSTFPQ
jgi:hypothetical protein